MYVENFSLENAYDKIGIAPFNMVILEIRKKKNNIRNQGSFKSSFSRLPENLHYKILSNEEV